MSDILDEIAYRESQGIPVREIVGYFVAKARQARAQRRTAVVSLAPKKKRAARCEHCSAVCLPWQYRCFGCNRLVMVHEAVVDPRTGARLQRGKQGFRREWSA